MGWTSIKWDDAMLVAAQRGLIKAGILVEGQAVRLCPVGQYPEGTGRVGGRLKGSITYATKTMRSHASGVAGGDDAVSTPADEYTVHVGTNVEYAPYVEYGTRRMRAQPYLRPALDTQKTNVELAYAEEISKELKARAK